VTDFRLSRLRSGEVIAALAAVILLIDLLAVSWYSVTGDGAVSATGWEALSVLRWLIALTVVTALALAWFQAARRAPALPCSLSVIATVLGALTTLTLIWRVLVSLPGPDGPSLSIQADAGAYVGLVSVLVLTVGALWSLRQEDPPDPVRNQAIEVVALRG
jgi:cytochrome bd-type quinol oxidase subunit 2